MVSYQPFFYLLKSEKEEERKREGGEPLKSSTIQSKRTQLSVRMRFYILYEFVYVGSYSIKLNIGSTI
uniref:Uncharacterized protein n=1 Tax=Octopus bimaculoides TaxID=37653 RepID=A0A0L8HW48_OCTBM